MKVAIISVIAGFNRNNSKHNKERYENIFFNYFDFG